METNDESPKLRTEMEKTENFKDNSESVSSGTYRNQILMVCLINMPMLAYGTTIGWLSPMAVLLQSKDTPASEPFTDEEVSWMAAILFLSAIFGTLLFSVIVDRIGRKKSTILASVPFLICWSLKLMSTKPWILITARGIAGFASGGGFFLSGNYVKEVSDDAICGALGSIIILCVNGGCFLMIILAEVVGYYTILYLCLSIPVIHIAFFVFMPESPMFLIKHGKKHEALKVMAWLKSTSVKDEETIRYFNKKKEEVENEDMDTGDSIISILTSKTMAKPVRITWFLVVLQEASGCLAVLLYAGTIFDLANRTGGQTSFVSKMTPNMQSIFVGILQVTGSILSITLVEKCGRRILLSSTLIVAAVCMGVLGSWFFLVDRGTQVHSLVPIAAMSISILAYTGGFCPMAFVILTDTLPFKVRSKLAALIYTSTWLVDSLFLKFFSPIANAFGIYTAFWIFTGILLFGFIFVLVLVPETKGRSYEQIINIINGRKAVTRRQSSQEDKEGMMKT